MEKTPILKLSRYTIFISFLLLTSFLLPGQTVLHGIISDSGSGEVLVSATVYDTLSGSGTVSNEYGFYSLTVNNPSAVICVSFVGYTPVYLKGICGDTALNISLVPRMNIGEVTVTDRGARSGLLSSSMSSHNISRMQLTKIPILFGEIDMVKALQYLPGVSSGVEGTSGIYVRGGSADQNLILLDGVPVYNVSHLFGFFSVFNGEAVNNATLYKAGFPARYSGRLSSVIDVSLKEGNMQEFHGSVSIGLIASSLMLEGPIVKGKTSFMLSGRRTYADLVSYPVQYLINKSNFSNEYFGYFFHDLNLKINHKFSDRSRLFLSTYMGKDVFYIMDKNLAYNADDQTYVKLPYKVGFYWGNMTSSLRWNYIWGKQLFSNISLSYSKYKFANYEEEKDLFTYEDYVPDYVSDKTVGESSYNSEYYSGIKDLSTRINFSWVPHTDHDVRFGLKGSAYLFEPGIDKKEQSMEDLWSYSSQTGADTVFAGEFTGYIEDNFSIGRRFKSNVGLSSTAFLVDNKTYFSFEPRVSARYMLTDNLAFKASVAKMSQNVHLLTNATVGLPTDVWVPSTRNIPPESSWQFAGGFHYQKDEVWNFSMEAFFKDLQNVVEYAEGAQLKMNDQFWEDNIISGSGEVYGAELFIQKTAGRLTGSFAYTLSKNTRTFEDIENGTPFPYKYDRRHDLSLLLNFQLGASVSLSTVWVYGSGIRTTIVDQTYKNPLDFFTEDELWIWGRGLVHNFNQRNGYQLAPYHRLDVGINFDKEKKHFNRTWSFGAYNAYNRKNPFLIYSRTYYFTSEDFEKRVYQVSLFPIIPYVRYSIKF